LKKKEACEPPLKIIETRHQPTSGDFYEQGQNEALGARVISSTPHIKHVFPL
jgi:hypothetical protein